MLDAMHNELETTFKKEFEAGKIYLMAASSSTSEVTADLISQIRESFPGMDVMCDDLSLGLSCHIGPDRLGIGCSCMPLYKTFQYFLQIIQSCGMILLLIHNRKILSVTIAIPAIHVLYSST